MPLGLCSWMIGGGVKVPLEPGTSPTFNHLFLGILATFPEGVIKIHPQLSELFC